VYWSLFWKSDEIFGITSFHATFRKDMRTGVVVMNCGSVYARLAWPTHLGRIHKSESRFLIALHLSLCMKISTLRKLWWHCVNSHKTQGMGLKPMVSSAVNSQMVLLICCQNNRVKVETNKAFESGLWRWGIMPSMRQLKGNSPHDTNMTQLGINLSQSETLLEGLYSWEKGWCMITRGTD
jgi:hypothetical protein